MEVLVDKLINIPNKLIQVRIIFIKVRDDLLNSSVLVFGTRLYSTSIGYGCNGCVFGDYNGHCLHNVLCNTVIKEVMRSEYDSWLQLLKFVPFKPEEGMNVKELIKIAKVAGMSLFEYKLYSKRFQFDIFG